MTTTQFCTFRIEDLCFGIEVDQVQEVVRTQMLTPVPLSHDAVRGLINLRGQIVTAVDLRRRLQIGDAGTNAEPMNVVVNNRDDAVSLLVDEIGDVVTLDESGREDVPETVPAPIRAALSAVYKMPSNLLLVLDADRALDLESKIH